MTVVGAAVFLYGPLAVVAAALCSWAAILAAVGSVRVRAVLSAAFATLLALWASGCLLALAFRLGSRDWVHLFWSAQVPMLGIFLGCGVLLACTWRVKASETPAADATHARRDRRFGGPLLFGAMLASLALAPLALELALPDDHPGVRATGAPVRALVDLAVWGLGGALPASLAPATEPELARGIAYLPREVTVPMATTFIAACLWIVFCAIAFAGRLVPGRAARAAFYLLAPPFVCALALPVGPPRNVGAPSIFDIRYLGALLTRGAGFWDAEPRVLQAYGPVLAGALLAALCLGVLWLVAPRVEADATTRAWSLRFRARGAGARARDEEPARDRIADEARHEGAS